MLGKQTRIRFQANSEARRGTDEEQKCRGADGPMGEQVRICDDRRSGYLGNGHFGLVSPLVGDEGESDGLTVGGLPGDGASGSRALIFADLLLGSGLCPADAISGFVAKGEINFG